MAQQASLLQMLDPPLAENMARERVELGRIDNAQETAVPHRHNRRQLDIGKMRSEQGPQPACTDPLAQLSRLRRGDVARALQDRPVLSSNDERTAHAEQ